VILSSAKDSNWRTRSATLTYLRTFMYRYVFGFVLLFHCSFWRARGGVKVLIFWYLWKCHVSNNFCFGKSDIGVSIFCHMSMCAS
jgi:hypothetical protein